MRGTVRKAVWMLGILMLALYFAGMPVQAAESACAHENTVTVNAAAATTESGGYTGDIQCVDCGETLEQGTVIARIKKVTLAKTSYTYNGKARTPSVTVTDADGNTISSANYTVTYKSNKKVGTATAVVKFSGDYSGTVEKTFKINPKSTTLSSLTAISNGFTAKWKKNTTQTTGYQIQCATNAKFTKNKVTETVESNKTTTASLSIGLKAKKKYYVRIRTYRTVDGVNYYSDWSAAKTVTTKQRVTVFVGDSISTGLYSSSYNGISYIKISGTKQVLAYTGMGTQTFLTKKYFSGQTGISKLLACQPYRVYIMFGMNEASWRPVSTCIKYYEQIIEKIRAKSPGTDIVLLACPPVTASKIAKAKSFSKITAYNAAVKAWAEENGVAYYDFTSAFKNSKGYLKTEYSGGDGVHWNRKGYIKFGELITAYDKSRG